MSFLNQVVVMDEGKIIAQGLPREIGEELKQKNHGMFLSMPIPMQIFYCTLFIVVCIHSSNHSMVFI